ncbi:MAG: right-handed parallel beta-helix repeat-containing protein [Bacteroidota bacterium]
MNYVFNYKSLFAALFLLSLIPARTLFAQPSVTGDTNPYVVSTFESAGIYWVTSEAESSEVRYREAGQRSWNQGLDLVYDPRDEQFRGSIVGLEPDTEYEVELSTSEDQASITFRTRNDDFPIGQTTVLPDSVSEQPVRITRSGSPDAYHLVTVPEGSKSVLNMRNHDYGIEIDADYVIVRGVEIRNARIHGILIKEGRRDIVIENSHITFWGRIGGPRTYGNLEGGMDSAIWAEEGARNITIQRNLLRDPRGAANDWTTGHPTGPQGISFVQSGGGHVIRYNEISSTDGHGFNDGIGGGQNYSFVGNMYRDSDIYGNLIRNVWDDAIESEGSNMNVRIWGNYIEKYFVGVATAATTKGPIYMFRNVFAESRIGQRNSRGGMVFKTGEREPYAGGRRYYFHNTALQPNGALHAFSSHVHPNSVTRNNIFDVPGRLATDRESEPESDYDYDYFSGTTRGTAQQENGYGGSFTPAGTDLYIPSPNLEFYLSSTIKSIIWGSESFEFGDQTVNITDPVVQIKNPLRDGGTILPGFNDGYRGEGPDLGAFEFGAPPLEFGRRAYLEHDEGWAPWERY